MNNFCDCDKDGYCSRYQREMTGRNRQICQGINVDLGTAAALRLQWEREAPTNLCPVCKGAGWIDDHGNTPCFRCNTKGSTKESPIPLLLKTNHNPGDCVALTAAIYSLHKAHPGKYLTAVETYHPEIFHYNPDIEAIFVTGENTEEDLVDYTKNLVVQMHYPAIHDSNHRAIHFMEAWCEFLSFALNDSVPLLTNRPHLYFPQEPEPKIGKCWLVCSGGKNDFTNKLWGYNNYQEMIKISIIKSNSIGFMQIGDSYDNHKPLKGVIDIIGRTNLRQLFNLVRCSRGVIGGVSLLMHIAAALEKPAIIIAGGREPVSWNAYPTQHYLHTNGWLGCSDPQGYVGGACWRSRTIALGDNPVLDSHPCLFPQEVNGQMSPKCMTMIDPAYVADLILKIDQSYKEVGNERTQSTLPLRLPTV